MRFNVKNGAKAVKIEPLFPSLQGTYLKNGRRTPIPSKVVLNALYITDNFFSLTYVIHRKPTEKFERIATKLNCT